MGALPTTRAWLDIGGDATSREVAEYVARKRKTGKKFTVPFTLDEIRKESGGRPTTKPMQQDIQLLDSTGKMTKARALANGYDRQRSARGSGR